MRVVITGATGFIGRALCRELHGDYEVVALSRDVRRAAKAIGESARVVEWDGRTIGSWAHEAEGALAIVNLAGENVASRRWSPSRKAAVLQSRLDSSRAVLDAVREAESKPRVVVQASATGYYGPRGDEELDEQSSSGSGFLSDVCVKWESFAGQVGELGVRCAVIRSGVVLGRGGGALARLVLPFRFLLGGHVGSGRQWFPWISLEDEIRAIRFLMENDSLDGAFNLTTPRPVTMKQFCRTLGRVLRRPCWVFIPGFFVRLALGEMGDEMLLSGQRALPKRLLEAGFEFRHADLGGALTCILRKERK